MLANFANDQPEQSRVLRAKRLCGLKFRRQHPMGNYIVDFACLEASLIVEVDGGQHADRQEYDRERTAWLEGRGFRVLRFWNSEVLTNIEGGPRGHLA